jgi:hypothetical protein
MEVDKESGLVKMPWNHAKNDETAQRHIIRVAGLLSYLRGVVPTWHTQSTQGSDYSYTLPTIEEPDRAIQQLTNLARGHALLKGRNYISIEDIPLIIKTALSTASKERVTIFDLLLANNGVLTTSQIEISLNIAPPTARRTMLELKILGLVDNNDSTEDINSVQQICLKEEFGWFLSEEFKKLREGFKPTDNSESLDEKGLKEKLPLSSIENFNSILNGNRDNKETDGPTNNTNNTLLDFECYYCEFKTDMKSNYERHVVQAHPKGQCYPSKMELARLGIEREI